MMLKILQVRLQQYVNQEFPDVQAWFSRGRGTRDQIANICWVMGKAGGFQKNIYFCFIDYAKRLWLCESQQTAENFKEMAISDHLTCLLRNLYVVKKQQLELDMEQLTVSKLGKKYIKSVYCHPAYLTYMQNTSCKMPGRMNYKLESRLSEEISATSDMQRLLL